MKIENEIILKEQEGKFCLFIPSLSLYSESDDLNTAYQDIERQKNDLLLKIENRNFGDYVAIDTKKNIGGDYKEILLFLTKYSLLALILMIFVFLSASFVSNKISQLSLVEIMKNQTRQALSVVDRQLLDVSDEVKADRIEKFSEFVNEMRPYLNVIQDNNK
tara:strand:- start:2189 stop:2674 length:486 start_codon:yes stop_codon:yes gene_type:complete